MPEAPTPAAPAPAEQLRTALRGVRLGSAAAAEDLVATVECILETGGFDEDGMRGAGLGVIPDGIPSTVILRGIAYGILMRHERPRVRRGAHRAAAVAGVDEGAAVVAVATAILATDLSRGFDLETALARCHQTLLEEAPMALLTRLRPLDAEARFGNDHDPTVALQLAITALARATGVTAVVAQLPDDVAVARSLAAALSGIRDGAPGLEASENSGPLAARADAVAERAAERLTDVPANP